MKIAGGRFCGNEEEVYSPLVEQEGGGCWFQGGGGPSGALGDGETALVGEQEGGDMDGLDMRLKLWRARTRFFCS